MKAIGTILSIIILSTSYAQDPVCDCYNKVKKVDFDNSDFQKCVELHREAKAKIESKMEELYNAGDRAKMVELQKQPKAWADCYLPEVAQKNSTIDFQFKETYGKINIVDMDIKFTEHNKYTGESYIIIDFADYDRMKNWQRPEGASAGSITILKKNDSLTSSKAFIPGDYQVKTKTSEAEWLFYVNYDINGHKYSGQYNGANPSADSRLKIISNNGRVLELEFSLITEDGETLKGILQVITPFTHF